MPTFGYSIPTNFPKGCISVKTIEGDQIQLLYAVNEMTISGFQADINRPPKEKKHIQIKS